MAHATSMLSMARRTLLPDRPILNAAFLCLAMARGQTAAITNPLEPTVQTAILAADLFLAHDPNGMRWIRAYRKREKARGAA